MSAPDRDAGRVGRNQRRRNTVFLPVADQVVRVIEFESKAKDRRDGRERNVSLIPVKPDARDLLAVPLAFADDPTVDKCSSVRSCLWRRQRKTGNLVGRGKPGQIVLFLFLGAIVQ